MKINSTKLAFSLIELSVVILIIGILVIGITKGSRIMSEAKLKSAKSLTTSSPVNSIEGLSAWFEASDDNIKTSTIANIATTSFGNISNGNRVSSWLDRNTQSVNKITTTSSTDVNRPVYITNGIGGLPTISFGDANFDAGQHYLDTTTNIPLASGDDDYSFVVVFRAADVSVAGILFSIQDTPTFSTGQNASLVTLPTGHPSGSQIVGFSGIIKKTRC